MVVVGAERPAETVATPSAGGRERRRRTVSLFSPIFFVLGGLEEGPALVGKVFFPPLAGEDLFADRFGEEEDFFSEFAGLGVKTGAFLTVAEEGFGTSFGLTVLAGTARGDFKLVLKEDIEGTALETLTAGVIEGVAAAANDTRNSGAFISRYLLRAS